MIVDELVAILGYDVKGEGELRRFNAGLENAQRKATAFAAAMIRIGTVAATAAATGMAALGKSVITVSAQFESYQATLETIEGSSAKAEKALDWISNFAKQTPFEVAELTEAFVRLRAYGMDPTSGLMVSLGDASSAMGKDLMSAVEMIADASTGEFERLKEFGIRASQQGDNVTFSWTENGKALTKTVKKNGAEIARFIQDQLGHRFSGAMMRQSKTWNGMMSNLGDSWVDFQRRIGEGGFFDAVKGQLGRLLDYISRLDADGTLDRWSRRMSTALTNSVDTAIYALDRLRRHFNFLTGWFEANPEWWGPIKLGLMAIGAYVFPKTAALLVLEDVLSYLEGGDSVIGELTKSLQELTGMDAGTIGNILATIAGAGAGLMIAWPAIRSTAGAIRALASALGLMGGKTVAEGLENVAKAGGKTASKGGISPFAWMLGLGAGAAVWGAAAGGINALINPGEAMNDSRRSKWGPDDLIRYLLGTNSNKAAINPNAPKIPYGALARDPSAHGEALSNASGNFGKMSGGAPATAVVNDNKQDNRNMSTTVNVGGVTVNGAQNAGPATGAAVGKAVGSAAAGAGRQAWHETGEKF